MSRETEVASFFFVWNALSLGEDTQQVLYNTQEEFAVRNQNLFSISLK